MINPQLLSKLQNINNSNDETQRNLKNLYKQKLTLKNMLRTGLNRRLSVQSVVEIAIILDDQIKIKRTLTIRNSDLDICTLIVSMSLTDHIYALFACL